MLLCLCDEWCTPFLSSSIIGPHLLFTVMHANIVSFPPSLPPSLSLTCHPFIASPFYISPLSFSSSSSCYTYHPYHHPPLLSSLRRIGVQEGSTRRILDHPFFSSVDTTSLRNGTLVPEFVPEAQSYHEPISTLKPVKAFSGDQKQFKDF
jgi:hypothetical protein